MFNFINSILEILWSKIMTIWEYFWIIWDSTPVWVSIAVITFFFLLSRVWTLADKSYHSDPFNGLIHKHVAPGSIIYVLLYLWSEAGTWFFSLELPEQILTLSAAFNVYSSWNLYNWSKEGGGRVNTAPSPPVDPNENVVPLNERVEKASKEGEAKSRNNPKN